MFWLFFISIIFYLVIRMGFGVQFQWKWLLFYPNKIILMSYDLYIVGYELMYSKLLLRYRASFNSGKCHLTCAILFIWIYEYFLMDSLLMQYRLFLVQFRRKKRLMTCTFRDHIYKFLFRFIQYRIKVAWRYKKKTYKT